MQGCSGKKVLPAPYPAASLFPHISSTQAALRDPKPYLQCWCSNRWHPHMFLWLLSPGIRSLQPIAKKKRKKFPGPDLSLYFHRLFPR